jgi:hypothetical protein
MAVTVETRPQGFKLNDIAQAITVTGSPANAVVFLSGHGAVDGAYV